jgi:hypothetical protein
MAWPNDDLVGDELDQSTDDPLLAQAQLNALHIKVKAMLAAINTGATPWDETNDGAGSGLDADKLDGVQGSSYSLVGHSHTLSDLTDIGKGALVTTNATTSLLTATPTKVIYGVETFDDSSIHTAGNPTRLTVPAGVTRIKLHCNAGFSANSSGNRSVAITKNGAISGQPGLPSVTGSPGTIENYNLSSSMIAVTAGNYFEVVMTQNSGVTLTSVNSVVLSWFGMEIIK